MMYRIVLLLLLLCLLNRLSAQTYIGLREVVNYEKLQYNAGAQNWDIRQDVQGRIYFANNEGLLCFDGIYWKLYPLPNRTIARSIEFGEDNRIYIGGQDEIGYFAPDAAGKLSFTSLRPLIAPADQHFADIWELVRYGKEIFFRSNNMIFRYTGKSMDVYHPAQSWMFMGLANGQLLAQEKQQGLLTFRNDQWETLIPAAQLPDDFTMVATSCLGADSCLVVARTGLYLLTGNKLQPFALQGLPASAQKEFSSIAQTDDDHFIIGTYYNGFYLINRQGVVLENFSKREGLQNMNVRSIFCDKNGNIWLGLDSGIDFIAFNNAIKHINPPVMNDGAGYAVATFHNRLYFGLSNGIYSLPLPDLKDLSYTRNDFSVLTGGQTWGLYPANDHLLAGTDDGFLQISAQGTQPVAKSAGYWVFQSLQNTGQHPMIVAGYYYGVRFFEYRNNTFVDYGSVPDFIESARFLVIDNNNTVWVSHPYRGVYKITVGPNGGSKAQLYSAASGLPSSLNNHVYRIKNRIVIATEKGVYEYNGRKDAFEPSADYRDIFGNSSVRYLKEDPSGNIWFVQEKNIGVVDFSTLKPSLIYLPELKGKIMSGFEHIYPINDNNIFVGGERGFYHINFDKYKQNSNHSIHVFIRQVKSIGRTETLLFGGYFGNVNEDKPQPAAGVPSVGHQWNSFHIEYSSPLFEQQKNIEYSYYLEGFDKDWSEWSRKTEKDYTNLPAGNYSFQVKARNNLRSESAVNTYSFTVLPPWYQTHWAYLLYFMAAVWITYLLYRKQRRKLMQERNKHQEEQKQLAYLHQLELEKSEKEVMRLRNEKLESEIGFKNTELASTAMHLVQKEEFLHKIKDELQHLNKNGKEKADPGEVKKILRILSEEEKLNEEWEQFSVHFDKVHGDFLVKLKEKYPDLKPHELKLCAYLRMNLSSKEIARLMSISVRGVEISRYRLRKKLGILTEVNLFQFLFDLQRNDFKA